MFPSIKVDGTWTTIPSTKNLVFVIKPGAGTFYNKNAYKELEQEYDVIYFGESGGEYDNYPLHWHQNDLVEPQGPHLGGIAELIKNHIQSSNQIPSAIICGSRGGQVTIGKIWDTIWRGPTVIINAGCLTTKTSIPPEVSLMFITMGGDYFTSVNTPEKVTTQFKSRIVKQNQKAMGIHLINQKHMPNLNHRYNSLLKISIDHLLQKLYISFAIAPSSDFKIYLIT